MDRHIDTILPLEEKPITHRKSEQMNLRAIEPTDTCQRIGNKSIYYYFTYLLFLDFNTGNFKGRSSILKRVKLDGGKVLSIIGVVRNGATLYGGMTQEIQEIR